MRPLQLSGRRFGLLIAIKPLAERRHGEVVWLAQCDCGRRLRTCVGNLKARARRKTGCGCTRSRLSNVIGKKFGHATVEAELRRAPLSPSQTRGEGKRRVRCRCQCGRPFKTLLSNLASGNTGCGHCRRRRGNFTKTNVASEFKKARRVQDAGRWWLSPGEAARQLKVTQATLYGWTHRRCPWLASRRIRCRPLKGALSQHWHFVSEEDVLAVIEARSGPPLPAVPYHVPMPDAEAALGVSAETIHKRLRKLGLSANRAWGKDKIGRPFQRCYVPRSLDERLRVEEAPHAGKVHEDNVAAFRSNSPLTARKKGGRPKGAVKLTDESVRRIVDRYDGQIEQIHIAREAKKLGVDRSTLSKRLKAFSCKNVK
jgi:hypothetical protein